MINAEEVDLIAAFERWAAMGEPPSCAALRTDGERIVLAYAAGRVSEERQTRLRKFEVSPNGGRAGGQDAGPDLGVAVAAKGRPTTSVCAELPPTRARARRSWRRDRQGGLSLWSALL